MSIRPITPFVVALADASATLEQVGGKGASLARLASAGLPVPPGFHVTTAAYRLFVAENGLQEKILAAVSTASPNRPATFDEAENKIRGLFADARIPDEIAGAVRGAYAALGGNETAVAVRSSATAEDLPGMSFAGQQETFLNMRGEAMVLDAVKRCWVSLWTARAIGYRARHGIPPGDVSLAAVVQRLVPAEAAGILFTANPVSGALDQISINAAWGLGESVVGGQVTADTMVIGKADWNVLEQEIQEKNTMTVRTLTGTADQPVPADMRMRPVLNPAQAAELARLGERIEKLYGLPMDIEWAREGGRFFILQARPITALPGNNPATGEHNDSLTGDFLWTNGNLGEAIPDVMTPCTWSLVEIFMEGAMASASLPGYRAYGNIGGRFYMNLSLAATLAAAFGMQKIFAEASKEAFGRLPEGMPIPLVPLSRWRILRLLVPHVIRVQRRVSANQKELCSFLASASESCEALHRRIQAACNASELAELWRNEVVPYFRRSCQMMEAVRGDGAGLIKSQRLLRRLVGEADATAMLTGLHSGGNRLASLGPLVGLSQLARGEIDRGTFARQWGHRGPHEFEVSIARPAENPDWIDKQLAGLREAPMDADALLSRQETARRAAWERFRQRYPRQVGAMQRRIKQTAAFFRDREEARSEVIRVFWVLRAFVLRAGALTGHGGDLFFLSITEILDVLKGGKDSLAHVTVRRETYARYSTLPPYPALIRGHFDPFTWAADPNRRSDVFDATHEAAPAAGAITGFPGAAGVVEGRVRVISEPEQGEALQPGEILVTTVTNVGWTPIFPRAAAVVTDIGAPLSHAAIVAREIGIPAVVGCGNATMRLRTGDTIRVNGGKGIVEVIRTAE